MGGITSPSPAAQGPSKAHQSYKQFRHTPIDFHGYLHPIEGAPERPRRGEDGRSSYHRRTRVDRRLKFSLKMLKQFSFLICRASKGRYKGKKRRFYSLTLSFNLEEEREKTVQVSSKSSFEDLPTTTLSVSSPIVKFVVRIVYCGKCCLFFAESLMLSTLSNLEGMGWGFFLG